MNDADHRARQDADHRARQDFAGFLPERVFDIHAHMYRVADLGEPVPELAREYGPEAGVDRWRTLVGEQITPAALDGGLLFPYPTATGNIAAGNAYLLEQVQRAPEVSGLAVLAPSTPRETAGELAAHPRIAGFKPYYVFSGCEPAGDARVRDYAPEWMWTLAHEHGLILMLHLVRHRALADEANQEDLVTLCRRYPNAKAVLAHAGRGFHGPNTGRGIESLRGLENVWFDTAVVCEAEPLFAVLDAFGPRRLLWGSDFPVSHQRGRCVTIGDTFAWVCPEQTGNVPGAESCEPWAVGFESLRALRTAASSFRLAAGDLEDIFRNNARRLLALDKPSGTVTQDLYRHAKHRIPGGVQLLSKRPEMHAPGQWPAYHREARGCEVWDLDGRHYYDMSIHGIGACLLGYRDPDVTAAVIRRIELGSMSTLSPPDEVELADRLCAIHPWAARARFCRTGGEAASVAVRIARATTGRGHVAICGYHGWHDWYLAANLGDSDALRGHLLPGLDPLGVPGENRGLTEAFTYNRRDEFDQVIQRHGEELAAVVMEPARHHDPEPGFLEYMRDQAHKVGALLVFDEITIGWRLVYGGIHLRLGVEPDIAIFAKALGNGHPVAAVIGSAEAMEGAETSFISSTYWTEGVGPAAALATLDKMARIDLPAALENAGEGVRAAWRASAAAHNLPLTADDGYACLAHFAFEHPQAQELRTLYTQLMLERGFLAGPAFYATLAHTDDIVALYAEAVDEVFGEIARVLAADEVAGALKGPPAHTGFRRLV